jgi:hypothetical protein
MTNETDTDMVTEVNPDVDIEVTPDVAKKAAKLEQLKRARESGVNKKAKRERDYDAMSSKLDQLSEYMTAKKEEEDVEPPQKRVRVTKENVETQPKESWVTAITRVSAVAALSAGGWYFQNVYGKPSVPPILKKKQEQKTPPVLQSINKNRVIVGKSGFVS